MKARQLLRAALGTRWTQTSQLPPTFLLPWRAQLHQAAGPTQFQKTPSEIPPHSSISPSSQAAAPSPQPPLAQQSYTSAATSSHSSQDSTSQKPFVISKSVQQLLPLLHSQSPHYITAHIHGFPYLLTEGDTLRLPFHMKEVSVGDVLRLNRASILGSRDYTLKAGLSGLPPNAKPALEGTGSAENPYLDERLFVCRARVIGVDTGPMMIKEKTKRRQRRVKTVKSKHKYTVLKIMEVKVKSLEEIAAEGGNEQLMVLE